MNVRQRRLKADYDRMATLFSGDSRIRVLKTLGNPPHKYQVEFLVTSLQEDPATGRLRTHNDFIAEINLTGGYPRMAPQCRMLTPVFHPNIAPHAICIGDHWAAGELLPHLVVRIAEMLAFQSYNVKSPLNGKAAKWAEQNRPHLPLDKTDFTALLSVGEAVTSQAQAAAGTTGACANCGKQVGTEEEPAHVCINQHVACGECLTECAVCGGTLCLKCPVDACTVCGQTICHKCSFRCSACGQVVCLPHTKTCHVCRMRRCENCIVDCAACGRPACTGHIRRTETEDGKAYVCTACAEGATEAEAPPARSEEPHSGSGNASP